MTIASGKGAREWLKGRNKHMTGFCNENGKPGQHEGTKPKTWNGKPLPVCTDWMTCPCECHMKIDEMFKMTGLERKLMPNPDYEPDFGHFLPPLVTEEPVAAPVPASGGADVPGDVERPVERRTAPATPPLAERRTDTGRAARGGLEAQVWEACHALSESVETLTPKVIGEWIGEKYTIPTPSSGAICAVWDRWERYKFATQAKKPNRFISFTGTGSWEELVRFKSSSKRAAKSAEEERRLRGRRGA